MTLEKLKISEEYVYKHDIVYLAEYIQMIDVGEYSFCYKNKQDVEEWRQTVANLEDLIWYDIKTEYDDYKKEFFGSARVFRKDGKYRLVRCVLIKK